jgi:hypothetical protein
MMMKTYQTLGGQLADQQLGALLVTTNLTKSDGTGLVTVSLKKKKREKKKKRGEGGIYIGR